MKNSVMLDSVISAIITPSETALSPPVYAVEDGVNRGSGACPEEVKNVGQAIFFSHRRRNSRPDNRETERIYILFAQPPDFNPLPAKAVLPLLADVNRGRQTFSKVQWRQKFKKKSRRTKNMKEEENF